MACGSVQGNKKVCRERKVASVKSIFARERDVILELIKKMLGRDIRYIDYATAAI